MIFSGSIIWVINPFFFPFNILPLKVVDSAHFNMIFLYHFQIIADNQDKLLSREIAKKKIKNVKTNKQMKTENNE